MGFFLPTPNVKSGATHVPSLALVARLSVKCFQLYPPVLCFHEISSSIIYDVQQSMIVCVVSGCGLGGSTTKAAPQTAAVIYIFNLLARLILVLMCLFNKQLH